MTKQLPWVGMVAVALAAPVLYAAQTTPQLGIRDKTPNLVALTNATVITEPGRTVTNATILIRNGVIESVRSGGSVPAGYQQHDLSGHYVYAGFIDPFTQYGVEQATAAGGFRFGEPPQYQNERKGGNASNAAIHAERRWADEFKPNAGQAKPLIEQGFTTVQAARHDGIFRGSAVVASLAEGLPNEVILKANGKQFMSFSKGSSTQSYPSSLMGSMALIRQTLSDANWYQSAYGKTDLRFHSQPIEYNAALAALATLPEQGVLFEASDEQSLLRAHQLLAEFGLERVALLGSGHEYSRLEQVKASNRTLVLPLSFPAAPDVHYVDAQLDVSLADLRHWERAPANPAAVAQAGVRFALTSHGLDKVADFWPNLRRAMQHGLTEQQALAALTTVPADLLGIASQLGKVQPGYRADLVVSRGNLFDDGAIVATWLRGQPVLHQAPGPDFSGSYSVQLAGQPAELTLTGRSGAYKGELKLADKSVKLEHLQQQGPQLQFSLALKELLERNEVIQFSGVLTDNQLTGHWLEANGQRSAVQSSRQPLPAKETASATEAAPLISQLTYPNRAFGVAELPRQQNLHIRNATVWTAADAGVLTETDVIIRDGRIQRIGQGLSTPRGYNVIDATGLHLTPGIIDEHSHIATAQGVNEGSHANTAEVRLGDVVNPDDINIYRGLAGGVTAVQLLHGSANPIGGQAQILSLRWGQDAEGMKFKDAPPSIKFALGENVKQSNWGAQFSSRYPQTRVGVETFIRDQFQAAKEYQAKWQAYERLSRRDRAQVAPPRRDYQLDTLVQILNGERHIHTHSYVASEILMLMELAEEMGFRIQTFTHILEGYKVASEMKAHGASVSSFADWWGFKMEVNDAIPTNTCLMHEQGLNVSVNSDDPGLLRRLNQEAAKSVMYCDMDEHEALKMVTINPAMQLKIADQVGSIETGKRADFVLWDGHPLSVYSQVQQTWIEGARYFDRASDIAKREQLEQERLQLIQKVLTAGDSARQGTSVGYKDEDPIWHCDDHEDWLQIRFGHQRYHQHGHHGHHQGHHHAGAHQ
ncbi:MAG: amidohydrolase family protein [Alkalimonas sp.]|nr:amidohydrolase family protein [Alkalimonas sp.]